MIRLYCLLISLLLLAGNAQAQCNASPTNIQVTAITATTATVTFNGSVRVLGCSPTSISYVYAGSSPVSVPYAKPLLLTGLPPSTAITVTIIRKLPSIIPELPCCTITASSTFTTAVPLAAATPARAGSFALVPNPARTRATLTLAAPLPAPAVAQVFDELGRELRQVPLAARATSAALDLTGLVTGLYLVRVGGRTARLAVE